MMIRSFAFTAAALVWIVAGCGGAPEYRSAQTNDQLIGHWKSESVKKGLQDQKTTYELFFVNNKTFIGAKRLPNQTISDSGFFSLDVANGTLEMGAVLKADQVLIDKDWMKLTTAAPSTEFVVLKRVGDAVTPKEFVGFWVCDKIVSNGAPLKGIRLNLNFRGANSYDMTVITDTDTQLQKGTFTYNSDYCTITFKPASPVSDVSVSDDKGKKTTADLSVDGAIVLLGDEIRIQTKKGVEFYFKKQ